MKDSVQASRSLRKDGVYGALPVNGTDITPTVNARLIDLTLTECRGEEADQLDLRLSDHDGKLEIPPKGATVELAIGWVGQQLIEKGSYLVDEVEHTGAPDVLSIRARSATLDDALRNRRDQSWHNVTLGAILTTIAKRNSVTTRIDAKLGAKAIKHIDQTNESDANFVTRLAKLYDAVATAKNGTLIFLPINGTTDSKGRSLPTITLTRAAGDQHRYAATNRDTYSGVRAYYHDPKKSKRVGVLVGLSGNAKRLRESYANEADARAAAQAEWNRIQRRAATLDYTLAIGRPDLMPQSPVTVAGFKKSIDETKWLVVRITHTIETNGGFTTRAEFEAEMFAPTWGDESDNR